MNQDNCKHEWLADPRKDKTQYCRKCFKWTGDKKKENPLDHASKEKLRSWLRASRINMPYKDGVDPFCIYQQSRMTKGKLLQIIVDEVEEFLNFAPQK